MSDDKVLSQDEVDALMNNDGGDGAEGGNNKAAPGEPVPIDFSNQERAILTQFPVLESINERLANRLSMHLYDTMGEEVEVQRAEFVMIKFADYLTKLKYPCSINVMRCNPLRGKALIIFNDKFIYQMVDSYFGSRRNSTFVSEERDFTPSEMRISEVLLKLVKETSAETWHPVIPLNYETLGFETNPELVSSHKGQEMMVVSNFKCLTTDKEDSDKKVESGYFEIVIPYSTLEPARERLDLKIVHDEEDIDEGWIRCMQDQLMDVKLMLNANLVKIQLTLDEMMELKVGDILPIELPEHIILEIENLPSFITKYGIANDKCALKILEVFKR